MSHDDSPMPADRYSVPALHRGLQMLALFSRENQALSGADFAHALGLPRASIFRMLQTLEAAGFVERIDDSSRYRLGVAVLRLGFEYIASMELTEHGRPILDALRDATGYSAHLVVLDQRDVVIVAKAVGFTKLFNSIQVGARLPAHATVLGRVLLSGLSDTALTQLYAGAALKRYTDATPVSMADLKAQLLGIVKRGVGVSEGGFEAGISTIAAPVFNAKAELQAALSITVPTAKIEPGALTALTAQVQSAAAQLTLRLGSTRQMQPQAA
jgi:DNA-binding IclR family transcriptional regulator